MYLYTTIKIFMKKYGEENNIIISDDNADILSFYAQQIYKKQYGIKLFEDYNKIKDRPFQWNHIKESDYIFLEKIFQTYQPLLNSTKINIFIAGKKTYNLIN